MNYTIWQSFLQNGCQIKYIEQSFCHGLNICYYEISKCCCLLIPKFTNLLQVTSRNTTITDITIVRNQGI